MSVSRRRVLLGGTAATAAAVAGAAGVRAAGGADAATGAAARVGVREPVEFTWWGNHAWQIRCGKYVVLTDPWLTRFHTGTYSAAGADPGTRIVSSPAIIDRYVTTADAILVHHGHYDHLPDVPYVARKTSATVLGNETHLNLLRALRAPSDQLSQVSGGEYLPFEGFTVEVFRSVHSCGGKRHQFAFPGTRPGAVPARPRTIADLVEGGTLAYVLTIGGLRILSLSTAGFDPGALRDLQVDVVLAAPGGEPGVTDRLLATLKPVKTVIATHWDDFDQPLDKPAVDWGGLSKLRTSVAAAGAEFVVVDHLQSTTL
ncbi:L-ascorbate metabolism protein UlaG (beta-lactamase superfamily) [Kribbella voronezhensis]|uniref:L-ascorbate metabolism protein UlaG (Beta-lactamase superfamily) n=1 Tax=Kribbella voronezhensis TaxID=2512212 RepID=A0A4R7TC89_9ACTN|nr:MBL fold metallo-hydrolase [Kribbella voronezhensis]TDU89076.1 L-ascorbate metabolism protein UlaG (beta-lactamase superfamily) [Kribbella voronezhensis]